ncbi:hypothetical protein ACB092_04G194100 [Castanea dentata]
MWYCSTFNWHIIIRSKLNSSSWREVGGIAQEEQHIMLDKRSLKTAAGNLEWHAREDLQLKIMCGKSNGYIC